MHLQKAPFALSGQLKYIFPSRHANLPKLKVSDVIVGTPPTVSSAFSGTCILVNRAGFVERLRTTIASPNGRQNVLPHDAVPSAEGGQTSWFDICRPHKAVVFVLFALEIRSGSEKISQVTYAIDFLRCYFIIWVWMDRNETQGKRNRAVCRVFFYSTVSY